MFYRKFRSRVDWYVHCALATDPAVKCCGQTASLECQPLNPANWRRCPCCRGPAHRTRRRSIDRLVSLILPRHRFRCTSIGCGWEGNLPADFSWMQITQAAKLMMGLTLALLALWSLTAFAHETDQYTLPVGREFADLGPHFSRVVHWGRRRGSGWNQRSDQAFVTRQRANE